MNDSSSTFRFDQSPLATGDMSSLSNELRRARRMVNTADRILHADSTSHRTSFSAATKKSASKPKAIPEPVQYETDEVQDFWNEIEAANTPARRTKPQSALRNNTGHQHSPHAKKKQSTTSHISWAKHFIIMLGGFAMMIAAIGVSAGIVIKRLDPKFSIGLGIALCAMTSTILSMWQRNHDLERENNLLLDHVEDLQDALEEDEESEDE